MPATKAQVARENAENGKGFESLFEQQAWASGFWPEKNHLSCRRTYGSRVQVLKSDLDFKLHDHQGRTGWFDTKYFDCEKFPYSKLDKDQIKRAAMLNDWNVPAGFVIWLRPINKIYFFSGHTLRALGPGSTVTPDDGICLGGLADLSLKPLLDSPGPGPVLTLCES